MARSRRIRVESGRRHGCKYCKKRVKRITDHFKNKHFNNTEVSSVLTLLSSEDDADTAQGVMLTEKLIRQGDKMKNYNVLKTRKGSITVVRCNDPDAAYTMYRECIKCSGFFKKT